MPRKLNTSYFNGFFIDIYYVDIFTELKSIMDVVSLILLKLVERPV